MSILSLRFLLLLNAFTIDKNIFQSNFHCEEDVQDSYDRLCSYYKEGFAALGEEVGIKVKRA